MTDRVGCGLPFFKSILGGRKAMSRLKRLAVYSAFLLAMGSLGAGQKTVHAQTLDDKALKGMKWRQIGPFRGGRALAVAGVAGDPGTYYFGAVAGGVWKTEKRGRTYASRIRSTSPRSWCIRKIPTLYTWRRWDTLTDRMKCAACFVRTTAARRGRKFYSRTTRPARSIWCSTRIIRTFCLPLYGKRNARHGA